VRFIPELLVSVRSAAEAETALANGAGLIDVKEPERGSLGRADESTVRAVVRSVAGRRPVSAALGELREGASPLAVTGLAFAKWGLAGCAGRADWRARLADAGMEACRILPRCEPVAVAYADWQRAQAPPPGEVLTFARARGWRAFLLDTWAKDGTTLLDWMAVSELARRVDACRRAGIRVALAGSIAERHIRTLLPLKPNWFAVRGAVCRGGRRDAFLDGSAVRRLAGILQPPTAATPGS
jgi:uncharacterized protein (UPF0264 family)